MISPTPPPRLTDRQIAVTGGSIHVEGCVSSASTAVFLHGWPQTWLEFRQVMTLLGAETHVVALDLPGVGGSAFPNAPGDKRSIAAVVHDVIEAMGLKNVTLIGHDIGGQVAFAYLVAYPDELAGAVMMDMGVPGIDPWDEIIRNPNTWHLVFHGVPHLPETLVQGKQREYFDFFYNAVNAHPESIGDDARASYVEAYLALNALTTGFGWYRGFCQDAKENAAFAASARRIATPVLYLRGEKHAAEIERYLRGLRQAGLEAVTGKIVADAGHFISEEQPREVAWLLSAFMTA